MKEEAAKLEEEAEFSEFSQEEEYRRRLRQEAEARAGDQVSVTCDITRRIRRSEKPFIAQKGRYGTFT